MDRRVLNNLAVERERRGWTQARAAEVAGISRQSYAAIESGRSVPSTEVALRLAHGLGLPVESLFRLGGESDQEVSAHWVGGGPTKGRRVRLARVAGRDVAYQAGGGERSPRAADGVVTAGHGSDVRIRLFSERPPAIDLVAAGCDPAFAIVTELLRAERGLEVLAATLGSRAALEALSRGEAHIAGMHLMDPETGEMNGPWIRRMVPFPCTRISFADWDQGLLLPAGNPAGLMGIEDLMRPGLRFLNRDVGSGSRQLIDQALEKAGISGDQIGGYVTTAATGHFAVGEAVAAGLADAGVGIRAAAAHFGLEMLTLRQERYELIIPNHFLDLPAVVALLDVVRGRKLRRQVEALDGYDPRHMGEYR